MPYALVVPLVCLAALVAVLGLPRLAGAVRVPHASPFVRFQLPYQLGLLALAAAICAIVAVATPDGLGGLLRAGAVGAPTAGVAWLGIDAGQGWGTLGPSLALPLVGATVLFLALGLRGRPRDWRALVAAAPWVLLFSLTNAIGEEAIFRLAVIGPLAGHGETAALAASAAIFGVAHLRGSPGGPVGVAMAGVLGWLLGQALLDTGGLAWPIALHALLDVPILAVAVLAARAAPGPQPGESRAWTAPTRTSE